LIFEGLIDLFVYKREQVREMFHHGYDSYMEFAFPKDELKPLTCTGWETWGK